MAFTNEVVDGLNILVKVDGKSIGLQTDGSMSIERETKEVKYKTADRSSSIYKQFTAGMISWSVSQSAYWMPVSGDTELTSFRDMFAKMTAATGYEVEVVVEHVEGASTLTYTGQAILTSLNPSFTNTGEDSTFSCELQGTGALTEAEVTA